MIEAPQDPLVGKWLRDKWRLDALLGRGGMSSVYAATHRNGLRGAIKILDADIAADKSLRKRFTREGYVANRIGHEGVVKVLDDDVTDDGLVFLVMELLEGETSKTRWLRERKRLPIDFVLDLGDRVLDILAAAHEQGVVHRDVKPDNVFLVAGGGIRLLDFGIARLRESSATTIGTARDALLGTPAFMPPEQARGDWDDVDARSDLFAVGATLWVLMSGKFIHDARTVSEMLVAAATNQVEPILRVDPNVLPQVAELIDGALRFDRNDRWSSAREMQDRLRDARDALNPPKKKALTKTLLMAPPPDPPAPPLPPVIPPPSARSQTYEPPEDPEYETMRMQGPKAVRKTVRMLPEERAAAWNEAARMSAGRPPPRAKPLLVERIPRWLWFAFALFVGLVLAVALRFALHRH